MSKDTVYAYSINKFQKVHLGVAALNNIDKLQNKFTKYNSLSFGDTNYSLFFNFLY